MRKNSIKSKFFPSRVDPILEGLCCLVKHCLLIGRQRHYDVIYAVPKLAEAMHINVLPLQFNFLFKTFCLYSDRDECKYKQQT